LLFLLGGPFIEPSVNNAVFAMRNHHTEAPPILVEFSLGKSLYDELESGSIERAKQFEAIQEAIERFERAAEIARQSQLFSPNEEVDDINTTDLK
jgi:hypothetical protein